MKILYKQPSDNNSEIFYNTYIKKISIDGDSLTYANKEHHHTCFEMHIIVKGYQTYIIDNKVYRVEAGSFLLIPPKNKHRLTEFSSHAEKFSITFITDNNNRREFSIIYLLLILNSTVNLNFLPQ